MVGLVCHFRAVKENQIEMFKLILQKDAGRKSVNMEDDNVRNVFHYAAEASTSEFLSHLKVWPKFNDRRQSYIYFQI